MLRLPIFRHHRPGSLDEALALLDRLVADGAEVKLVAGGTDLLPNMKHQIETPEHVVSLRDVGLGGARREGDGILLGAMTTVQDVADDPLVQTHLPALAEACRDIAGPQLRRMGTLGGNICLDTRCLYINQSHFWRQALGFCLKKDGTVCHVVAKGRRCVAAASNDSALPLLMYRAEVEIASTGGRRWIPLTDLYVADGVDNTILEPNQILTRVRVPVPEPSVAVAFEKLKLRRSIDFPLLNLAVRVRWDGDTLAGGEMVVSALGARPKQINLDKVLAGKRLDGDTVREVGRKAHAACRPLTNLATDPGWRREMIPVLVGRAMERLGVRDERS